MKLKLLKMPLFGLAIAILSPFSSVAHARESFSIKAQEVSAYCSSEGLILTHPAFLKLTYGSQNWIVSLFESDVQCEMKLEKFNKFQKEGGILDGFYEGPKDTYNSYRYGETSNCDTEGMCTANVIGVTPDFLDTVKGSRTPCTRLGSSCQVLSAERRGYNLQTILVKV